MAHMSFDEILGKIRAEAKSPRDLGDKFERLMVGFLRTDPIYVDRFSKVWMWSDWLHKTGADTGIDLVAQERDTGEYCAIQCKCFDDFHSIQKSDIDSFFTASGQQYMTPKGPQHFAHRLIISTPKVPWSINAEKALGGQNPPARRIGWNMLATSPVNWAAFRNDDPDSLTRAKVKQPLPHQRDAIAAVDKGFAEGDRGKLIMACGTGKTLTGLRIAEKMSTGSGVVMVLVPSISLLSQTFREWMNDAEKPFHPFAVCSDRTVGRKEKTEDLSPDDLVIPPTTKAALLAEGFRRRKKGEFTVIFSTYHSIAVVAEAQRLGVPEFDLIICDEAHRTTGVTGADDDETHFVQVHDASFVKAAKRLYMTATPRVYAESAKAKATENEFVTYSMDDLDTYGPEFYRLGFGKAVEQNLLADYKVLILAVSEAHISKAAQQSLADENKELQLDDAVKIIGCWNGLSKYNIDPATAVVDPHPMRRAVAFATTIKDSKKIRDMFQQVVEDYAETDADRHLKVRCELEHVDGTMNVIERNNYLRWLKESPDEGHCRILTNARCLTEGVDVPALDAVLFLKPRDSQVDVVQAVGRVMRRAEGKKYGYVILPIGIPAGISPEEALADNKKYRVVWQVLQALRAHDERFEATINKIELNKEKPAQIQIIGTGFGEKDTDKAPTESAKRSVSPAHPLLGFAELESWTEAIYARLVLKCGKRQYWEQWASDVADIASKHVTRLTTMVSATPEAKAAFERFLAGLHSTINPAISEAEAIDMLSQQMITRPIFDALFESYEFSRKNPVSLAMDEVLTQINAKVLETELKALEDFYASVRRRVEGIDNSEARQRIVIELYDKFFRLAFPRMAERLGIVYTPVEVVDFIVRSVDVALQEHFDGTSLSDENVHILDPFTGTGTFIVRLLQNGLIRPDDLQRKYQEELHANEIVLLAYYIAAVNIESAYHDLVRGLGALTHQDEKPIYLPFPGAVLTDTFQLGETGGRTPGKTFSENSYRAQAQQQRDIRVIIGNPPYSAQQESENDNNQNLDYPELDAKIAATYAAQSGAKSVKNLYDSYVRAIRWASDRIGDAGVIGFVTNGSFIDANNMDGLRKCMADEFSAIYCFNLRGNQRTSGERSRQEGGKIFGSGSRAPIAINVMVKAPDHAGPCKIHYYDIGDYHTREDKLRIISEFRTIDGIQWTHLGPNEEGDWVNQRDPGFLEFMPLGDKKGGAASLFHTYSLGVNTARDSWAFNFCGKSLVANMSRMIDAYNADLKRYMQAKQRSGGSSVQVEDVITQDHAMVSWARGLKNELKAGRQQTFEAGAVVTALYRPYSKQFMYFCRRMNEMVYQVPVLFPTARHVNYVVSVTGLGATKAFSALVMDVVPNLETISKGQCFPRYWYEQVGGGKGKKAKGRMDFGGDLPDEDGYVRHDAITDQALSAFQKHYKDKKISKDDLFWYVYGLLHSPEYREKYATSLSKMLPRIPFARDFWAFSRAGRELGEWHLNYETIEPWPLEEVVGGDAHPPKKTGKEASPASLYRVEKMKYAGKAREPDKSTIIYNAKIKLHGIPEEAHRYIVNGKSALDWVMERYQVKTDKASGIKNDPNEYSDDPRYIIDLVKRVVRISVETVKIVEGLPGL